jgi:Rps23 Pro-64 3,4-dihydroxylase Tpa1-like proline 4-hydroxylase
MTSKQILDAFSETLMQDERILSPRERELLSSLLHNAKEASGNPQIQSAVNAAIARSVGETVAQRAFGLLGSSIVEQIVNRGASSTAKEDSGRIFAGPDPTSPSKGPGPEQQPAGPGPDSVPASPRPVGPQPPGVSLRYIGESATRAARVSRSEQGSVALLDLPEVDSPTVARAQCVVLDEFLSAQEMEELIRYSLEHEADFRSSEVVAPSGSGVTDFSHRRSRVLHQLGSQEEIMVNRVRAVLPKVLEQLGMDEFPITRTEVQITASNDGDFFHAHSDNGQEVIGSRKMTFVYFFHREPSQFEGGELRLHDAGTTGDHSSGAGRNQPGGYQTIVPRQNQIVFFPCSTLHEITPVRCGSRAFADSRFTLNGWLHQ